MGATGVDWNAFFDQTWVQVLLTVLGFVAGAAASLAWAGSNAERLGRLVGARTPGDGIDRFLAEFARGFARGLESTFAQAEVNVKPVGAGTYHLEVKAAPLWGEPPSSGSAASK